MSRPEVRGKEPVIVGRYALCDEIGAGGMASVLLGRQLGSVGFSRVVAIKRLHPGNARDPEFVEMFLDEARLAARVRHPNVVGTLDVVHEEGELFIVMEHVLGESVGALLRATRKRGERVPPHVAASIAAGALHGLHAAHEATAEDGSPLGIIHRDVSPQNILVGADGIARVLDFGIAKANVRLHQTRDGHVKGKLQYMAPEQVTTDTISRAADIYAMGIVLWELCAGRRAFDAQTEGALLSRVIDAKVPDLSSVAPWVPEPLAAVVGRAIKKDPDDRYATAREMAADLERGVPRASTTAVAEWVAVAAAEVLEKRRAIVRRVEAYFPRNEGDAKTVLDQARALAPAPTPSSPTIVDRELATSRDALGFDHLGKHTGTHTITNPRVDVRRTPWGWIAGGAILGTLVASAWLFETRHDATRFSAATELTFRPGELTIPHAADTVPLPRAPVETAVASAAPASSATKRAPPALAHLPPGTSHAPFPTAAPANAPVGPSPCDPPTYTDANGIQRVKRECLGKLR